MEKLSPVAVGLTSAITFSIIFTACAIAVALAPDMTVGFFNAWFHGLDLSLLKPAGGKPLTLGQYVYGLPGVALVSFVTGALFSFIYNLVMRQGSAPRPVGMKPRGR
jgi:2TM family of unknown function (DUF5676)